MAPVVSISQTIAHHFERRRQKNASYSLRAFARDLALSPSFLSQLLSEKRGLSSAMAETIADKLQLCTEEREYFIAQSIILFSRSGEQKSRARDQMDALVLSKSALALKKDEFAAISEWYHFAVFQCLFLKTYPTYCKSEGETGFLARFLKMSTVDAEHALARLVRLGIIAKGEAHHSPLIENMTIRNQVPNAAIRKFHRQIIQKSLVAMEAKPVNERIFNTTTLTIKQSELAEIEKDYIEFYQNLVKKYSKRADSETEADSVYAFSTQIFSLSHSLEET